MDKEKMINELAAHILISVFDDKGDNTEKLLERINADTHVPPSFKVAVYERCTACINKILIEWAKQLPEGRGGRDVGSKEIPAEDPETSSTDRDS